MELKSINPATGKLIKTFAIDSSTSIKNKIEVSQRSFLNHKSTSFSTRAGKLKNLAKLLNENKIRLAEVITSEMGKTSKEAIAEIEKCALVSEYYATHGTDFLKNEKRVSDATTSFIRYEPLGVLLAVMPWNFPFWQVMRFAVPALLAGNTVLLKHASNVI